MLRALPRRLTGPGVPRQLEAGFLGEDGTGRLVLVRLDSALQANPGDWDIMVGNQRWDQLGKGKNHLLPLADSPSYFAYSILDLHLFLCGSGPMLSSFCEEVFYAVLYLFLCHCTLHNELYETMSISKGPGRSRDVKFMK